MNQRKGGSAIWWWLVAGGLLLLAPAFCCCGLFTLGALSPSPASAPPVPEPVYDPTSEPAYPSAPERPVVAEVEASESVPEIEEPEVLEDEGLPGFGATRTRWDATHQSVGGFAAGAAYGPMLRSTEDRGFNPTYAGVFGRDRILSYIMNLPPNTSFDAARARVRRELPADAREVRTRRLRQCRMVRYRSPTFRRVLGGAGSRGDVEVAYFSNNPDVFNPRRVTFVTFGLYVGEDIDC